MTLMETDKIKFYLYDSEAFKCLIGESQFRFLGAHDGVYPSSDGSYHLYVTEENVESIKFYIHEFTELILRIIIIQGLEPLKQSLGLDYYKCACFGREIAHQLSKETEGDGTW